MLFLMIWQNTDQYFIINFKNIEMQQNKCYTFRSAETLTVYLQIISKNYKKDLCSFSFKQQYLRASYCSYSLKKKVIW